MHIAGGIYADTRYKKFIKFYVRVGWTEAGKRKNVKISTSLRVFRDCYDLELGRITGTDEQSIGVAKRIEQILSYIQKIDLPSMEENVASIRDFARSGASPVREVVPTKFRDFITEYIQINRRLLSVSRLKQYKVTVRNLELFVEQYKLSDVFSSMSRTQQTTFLSRHADFLLEEHPDKPAYENASVLQEFSRFSAIMKSFPEAGLIVNPRSIVSQLRRGGSDAAYCSESELREVVKLWEHLPKESAHWKAVSLFLFSAMTGLRFSELSQVVNPAITTKNGVTTLTYTSSKKGWITQVPLSSLAIRILNEEANRKVLHDDRRPVLLPTLSSTAANSFLHKALERIPSMQSICMRIRYRGSEQIKQEIPKFRTISMHSGRHTFSHLLTTARLGLTEVGQLMSHGSVETTNKHYKHMISEDIQRQAVEILNKIV